MSPPNCLAPGHQHEGSATISFCERCYVECSEVAGVLAEACEVIRAYRRLSVESSAGEVLAVDQKAEKFVGPPEVSPEALRSSIRAVYERLASMGGKPRPHFMAPDEVCWCGADHAAE